MVTSEKGEAVLGVPMSRAQDFDWNEERSTGHIVQERDSPNNCLTGLSSVCGPGRQRFAPTALPTVGGTANHRE
jgi:hypothetical protein